MDRTYYAIDLRLERIDYHLAWFTNEVDGILMDGEGRILACRELSELRAHAVESGISLQASGPGSRLYDFDEIERWMEAPTKAGIDCGAFLDSWNLLDDIARSVKDPSFDQSSREADGVYDKLFWGSNLPAVTPPGEHFDPVWTDQDIEVLCQLFREGMAMLRRNLRDGVAGAPRR